MARIVLTGTTGHVGGGAARELAAAGHPLLQIVRDPARAPSLPGAETAVVAGMDDREGLLAACRPGDRVFMVSAWTGHEERLRLHRAFVDAAADAGVAHLVYLSFVNASPGAAFPHARSHADTEEHIRASGVPFTFLRTSYYNFSMEAFFLGDAVRGPGGRVGWVSRADCASAVAAAMAGGDHAGQTLDVTGPDAPTLQEAADRVGAVLGAPFRYVREDEPAPGGPEWKEGIRLRGSRAILLGELANVGDGVQRLTGREPRSIEDYALANPERFTGSPAHPPSRPARASP
jgi:NAD(P)H dehydrogenase (quinone)